MGAHLKNSIAVAAGDRIVLSQHIGDLETKESLDVFQRVVRDLPDLHDIRPTLVACDLHPDYLSTQHAHTLQMPVVEIQHHLAHVYACMAEQEIHPPILGISWDGTGLGADGTAWGGEFLLVAQEGWKRFASLRPFRLPGGDAAAKEPRRSALSLLFELIGESVSAKTDMPTIAAFTPPDLKPLLHMLSHGIRSPYTSSAGRLFDAVASLIGTRQIIRHEGQAAMQLEWLARSSDDDGAYSLPIVEQDGVFRLDWGEMVLSIVEEHRSGIPAGTIARRFHNALVQGMVMVSRTAGVPNVVLTGGCFQNGLLTELAVHRLRDAGFTPWWHQRIPPNDGGIAAGQAYGAAMVSHASSPARLAETHT
jgi:hydrogenase maturation protein HypF